MSVEQSFLDLLIQKLAFVTGVKKLGVSTKAAQRDVLRQMRQVSKAEKGDIISGKGVTKSGIES